MADNGHNKLILAAKILCAICACIGLLWPLSAIHAEKVDFELVVFLIWLVDFKFVVIRPWIINRLALRAVATRGLATTAVQGKNLGVVPSAPGYKKVQDLQTEMTLDDGLLVWEKRGMRDRIPYVGTLALCVASFGLAVYTLIEMSFPKKNN